MKAIAKGLRWPVARVRAAVELLDAGNTVPFITRFRRDATGGMDEEQVHALQVAVAQARQLNERKGTILRSIEAQGRLTSELAEAIRAETSTKRLEDLYLPFKPKKQTWATQARERGLAPLAEAILVADPGTGDPAELAARLVDAERGVPTVEDALAGAGHILAEQFAELAELRSRLRWLMCRTGQLVAAKLDEPNERAEGFRDFFDFRQELRRMPPHRVLAINRGERFKVLRVRIDADQEAMLAAVDAAVVHAGHPHAEFLQACGRDALRRLLWPSLEREVRRELTERAETHAVGVFARNLRNLLLQPPVRGRRVLAIDPGFRSGCKLVALDEFGQLLEHGLVHVIGAADVRAQATQTILELVRRHELDVVAIGNGAACRATEQLVAELIEAQPEAERFDYVIVNEAGASVYSASPAAREELPQLEASVRSAVSIGRRLQDPLSELVKIEPSSIGVGLYQHDVKSKHLRTSLDDVVASCVNFVGVDLNTASAALLRYVSGLNQATARRVIEHRAEHGPFADREALKAVPGLGEASFVQSAGFLKIVDGTNPLDATWIHPENYDVAERLLARFGFAPQDLRDRERVAALASGLADADPAALAAELGVGEWTLQDLVAQLSRPGRDPREDLPPPIFKRGILKLEDLAIGMELAGRVLNVVDFGAFVDIGLNYSGLVHLSQLADRYVASPHEIVSVGDVVTVWVLGIDKSRRRVSLTMLSPQVREQLAAREATGATAGSSRMGRTRRRTRPATLPTEVLESQAAESQATSEHAPAAASGDRPLRGGRRRMTRAVGRGTARQDQKQSRQPPKPLSTAMQEGREPLRSFGELKLFLDARGQSPSTR
ncbi:MAG: RNA-binding transcriptional accessory protein [Pirellulales bacterium]|nr:RNA-binding transcriptional accessory protein [Pirellulales bacterium]